MVVIAPADSIEMEKAIRASVEVDGPVYIRLGRDATPLVYAEDYEFRIGKAVTLTSGADVAILASGAPAVSLALEAERTLRHVGVAATVVNVHTVKPLDVDCVLDVAARCGAVVTVESHSIVGGLGGAVAELVCERYPVPMRRIGVADRFCETVGSERELLGEYGVSAERIVQASLELVHRRGSRP
jgi:transketolase